MRRLFLLGLVLFAAAVPYSFAGSSATATTYYVSPSGSDSNPGSASAPWQTIARVNRATLSAGDTVLFQGGQTFANAGLIPPASGTASAPIRFGSYGTGRARFTGGNNEVWIPSGGHDLVFDNLDFSGSSILFTSSARGSGTYGITIQNSNLHDTAAAAISVTNPQDHDWTIKNDILRHTGDSGMIIWGSRVTVTHSTISDTGWNPAITWGKHGIYDKGPDTTIADSDFSNNAGGQAISLRFHGAHVYGNTIHDTPYGIAFFDYDTAPAPQGTNYIYDNRLWNISGYGFYYSSQADPQGNAPTVGFVLASNTFSFASASEAVNVSEIPGGATATLANNIFTGSFGSAYRGCATCSEFSNDWYGGSSNFPNGKGDKRVNPALSPAPRLAVPARSPVRAAGTALVRGLTYKAVCDGGILHYCGSRPDLGAIAALSTAVTSRLGSGSAAAANSKAEAAPARAKPTPTRTSTAKRAKAAKRARVKGGILYHTYKRYVRLRGAQTLHFSSGKGYYAA